ncbi:MAG: hypothetical protein KAR40_17055 [Candidatus Sabulitectum sp.]|nr:hypothetical protein [Candidatus Sabulitectum sp.]
MTATTVIILDACVLINLADVGKLDILKQMSNIEFLTTKHVIMEVTNEAQKEKVQHCITTGLISVVDLTQPHVIEDYIKLNRRLGKGESSCIALATENNWIVCTDDKKRVPKTIFNRLGPNHLFTTNSLLDLAISQKIISEEDKTEIKENLKRISAQRIAAVVLENL